MVSHLREERRLGVCENRVLKRIFGPEGEQVTKEWRKLHNEEFNDLVVEPEGKRPLGRPRRRWEDIIQMALQEARCGDTDWIELAQDRDSWGHL